MTSHHDVGLQGPGARLQLGREMGREKSLEASRS
jgi:hypothetical protein